MAMRFTKIPADTFAQIQANAGILLDSFNPTTGVIGNILCATTGGLNFNDNPSYTDFGEDVDNCAKNTKELKRLDGRDVTIAGTGVTVTPGFVQKLIGAADIDALDSSHVIPRSELDSGDFHDLWWVGDYSNKNGASKGGFMAVHMKDALSTGGLQIQSGDKAKGQFAFTFTAHTSIQSQDTVPYDVYVRAGESESGDYRMDVSSVAGTTTGYTAITVGKAAGASESYVYQTGMGLYVPSKGSTLVGSAWTEWDGDDEIEAETGMDIIVAIIDSENKSVYAGTTIVTVKES